METAQRTQAPTGLAQLLAPQSVAVIGASPRPGSVGHAVLKNLLRSGFAGDVFPVHPTAKEVLGVRAYARVEDLPKAPDLAVVVVPAEVVLDVVEACGRRGVKSLVVISAGFRESGPEGAALEARLGDAVRRHGMRMIGPNCLGVVNPSPAARLNVSFAPTPVAFGRAALMTQSGALGIAILEHAAEVGLGLARFVSMGNKTDVSGNDLLLAWEDDPEVGLILLYLESFGNPQNFLRIARRVARKKPIVVIKSGRSKPGARAAASHTGALAEADAVVEALLEQCGVLRAQTMEELFDVALALSAQLPPPGDRIAILTNSGGPGIMAADALEASRLRLAELAPETRATMRRVLPSAATSLNPCDLLAAGGPEGYQSILDALLEDPGVDGVVAIYTPPMVTDDVAVAQAVVESHRARPSKPILSVFLGRHGGSEAVARLMGGGVPVYAFPENAVRALAAMRRVARLAARPEGLRPTLHVKPDAAESALASVPHGWLPQDQALRLVQAYGIPVTPARFAATADDAAAAARELGFPAVVKAEADGLVHKSRAGAVALDLRDEHELREAVVRVQEAAARAGGRPRGVLVMRQAREGPELLLGIARDPKFGAVVACGLGGVHTELHKDVKLRLPPFADEDAREMVRSLRGYPLLQGRDEAAVVRAVLALGQLALDHPEVAELDVNPVRVGPVGQGLVALDARVRCEPIPRPKS